MSTTVQRQQQQSMNEHNTTTEDSYWSQLATSMVDKIIGKPSEQQYQLLEVLGHGAYGCLFLGQSLQDHSYTAIKVLSKSGLDEQQLSLQQLEIDIQTSLNKHPHILALHHTINEDKDGDDYLYMVMELCDGGDLFDFVLQQLEYNNNNLMEEEGLIKKLFTQILTGVEYMHQQGVYHRDLKLENILLKLPEEDEGVFSLHDEDDEDLQQQQSKDDIVCKVADFGLATRERFSMEYGCGSPSYLAPEHFSVHSTTTSSTVEPYDAAASDIWSLGILLLALMFGRNPWQEASLDDPAFYEFNRSPQVMKQQLFPDISMPLYHFLSACLSIDPQQRPSITELKAKFLSIDHLFASPEEEAEDEEEEEGYVSIPNATTKKNVGHSFDSAFFSAGGLSWSDMMDEEDQDDDDDEAFLATPPSTATVTTGIKEDLGSSIEFEPKQHYDDDEDDTDMFVHRAEKESWWL